MSPQRSFAAPPCSQLVPNTTSRFFIGSQELRVFHLAPREVTQSNKYQEERSPAQIKGRAGRPAGSMDPALIPIQQSLEIKASYLKGVCPHFRAAPHLPGVFTACDHTTKTNSLVPDTHQAEIRCHLKQKCPRVP